MIVDNFSGLLATRMTICVIFVFAGHMLRQPTKRPKQTPRDIKIFVELKNRVVQIDDTYFTLSGAQAIVCAFYFTSA